MKKVSNIFQYVTITIGFIVIVIFLLPRLWGINPYIVLSGSMEETIKTGSVAYVNTNVKADEIKVGDIIAFKINTKQVTHRVVEINADNSFTTKGDANDTVDLVSVKFDNYTGKTIFSIPYLGYILSAMQTKIGYLVLILIAGLNIVLLVFPEDENKDKKNNKDKKADIDKSNEKEKTEKLDEINKKINNKNEEDKENEK